MSALIIVAILYLTFIYVCRRYTARRAALRGRSKTAWFVLGCLFYPFPYIVLALLPPLRGGPSGPRPREHRRWLRTMLPQGRLPDPHARVAVSVNVRTFRSLGFRKGSDLRGVPADPFRLRSQSRGLQHRAEAIGIGQGCSAAVTMPLSVGSRRSRHRCPRKRVGWFLSNTSTSPDRDVVTRRCYSPASLATTAPPGQAVTMHMRPFIARERLDENYRGSAG
jgi:hypothetical protein